MNKKNFYVTVISPLFTAIGEREKSAGAQPATGRTARYRTPHLTCEIFLKNHTFFILFKNIAI